LKLLGIVRGIIRQVFIEATPLILRKKTFLQLETVNSKVPVLLRTAKPPLEFQRKDVIPTSRIVPREWPTPAMKGLVRLKLGAWDFNSKKYNRS